MEREPYWTSEQARAGTVVDEEDISSPRPILPEVKVRSTKSQTLTDSQLSGRRRPTLDFVLDIMIFEPLSFSVHSLLARDTERG